MIYARIADPPDHLEKEAEMLAAEFFELYDSDDIIPDEAYWEYFYEHGSKELVEYLKANEHISNTE
ncbi:MAG: hypothetical protein IJ466_11570 [Clostridia bacterium]|nr:hypothetical protein [Clostridia bacterium]